MNARSGGGLRRVALRNLFAHKIRLLLSLVAVLLGVSFVTGSLVFTSTLRSTFDELIAKGSEGLTVQVSSKSEGDSAGGGGGGGGGGGSAAGVPLDAVGTLRAVPGVAKVVPAIEGTAILLGRDGRPVQTGGAPSTGVEWTAPEDTLASTRTVTEGHAPAAAGEIALSTSVLGRTGYAVGDTAKVYTSSKGVVEATIVGGYTTGADEGGRIVVGFSPAQARGLFTDGAHVAAIGIAGAEGVSQEELRDRIAAAVPDQKVETGDEVRAHAATELRKYLDFVSYFLVAFGSVALVVGTFIIYNTFAMLVTQRLRELGLLRAIGASRGQIVRSVVVEALLTGIVGSALGVAAGFGLARLIFVVLEAFDYGLPTGGLTAGAATVAVPLVLGVLVTVVSALVPALRAGRVAPVDAMRTSTAGATSARPGAGIAGVYLLVLGVLLAVFGTWNDSTKPAAITVGLGALAVIVGAFLVMPAMARPIAGGIGRVIGAPFGTVGRLAATNAGRNAWRTAATAFALTLGLTLVSAFGTLAASTKASMDSTVSKGIQADYIVRSAEQNGPMTPMPADLPARLRAVSGVADVVTFSGGVASVGGQDQIVGTVDGPVSHVADPELVEGTLDPGPSSIAVSQKVSRERGWTMGTQVPVVSPLGETFTVTVTGVYRDANLLRDWYAGPDVLDRLVPKEMQTALIVLVGTTPGADGSAVRDGLDAAAADVPIAAVLSRQEFVDQSAGGVDQLLTIIYALLGLALVVAVLGIVNTLALSVTERRTEIGMLRAVGMQRAQVRRTIVLESTQIAVFGAVVGTVVGVFLGWAFVTVLASQGLDTLAIPWTSIGVMLVASAVVGVVAAIVPAFRAARTSPLEAIAD